MNIDTAKPGHAQSSDIPTWVWLVVLFIVEGVCTIVGFYLAYEQCNNFWCYAGVLVACLGGGFFILYVIYLSSSNNWSDRFLGLVLSHDVIPCCFDCVDVCVQCCND